MLYISLQCKELGFGDPRIEKEWIGAAKLTITPTDSPTKFVLPNPTTLGSAGLGIFGPQGRMLPPGGITMILLN